MRGRELYMPARFTSRSEAAHASFIQIVGRLWAGLVGRERSVEGEGMLGVVWMVLEGGLKARGEEDQEDTYRPSQNVMTGDLYSCESCSKKYHGFEGGRRNVLPMMGQGHGPGGWVKLVSQSVR